MEKHLAMEVITVFPQWVRGCCFPAQVLGLSWRARPSPAGRHRHELLDLNTIPSGEKQGRSRDSGRAKENSHPCPLLFL